MSLSVLYQRMYVHVLSLFFVSVCLYVAKAKSLCISKRSTGEKLCCFEHVYQGYFTLLIKITFHYTSIFDSLMQLSYNDERKQTLRV